MKRCFAFLFLAGLQLMAAPKSYDPNRLEREILVPASRDALQLEVLGNGDVVFVEFAGAVKRWSAESEKVVTLGRVPTHAKGEVGLLGFAVSPDYLKNGYLFALYCPEVKKDTMRVSRFTVKDDKMSLASEDVLLAWEFDDEHIFHMGGAVFMDGRGHLYIGNGDNCHWNPGLPLDLRPGRKSWDALRSAGNSQDLRGKILRIKPKAEGGYTIPKGNLFKNAKFGRLEIYAMGVRNPFRMTVDDTTGTLYFGDVGPNVKPELKVSPLGYDEINAAPRAGNFGWPLFIGANESLPIYDFDKNKEVRRYPPAAPENPSPNNTGLKKLPPALPPLIWYDNPKSARFPTLGIGGRSIMAGPVYHFDRYRGSAVRLPKALDGRLFIYEWMRNWIQMADLATPGPTVEPFVPDWNLRRPIDLKLGPDGALYLIEYGDKWWENTDSRISRIVYRRGNRAPKAVIDADVTAGRHPLRIMFDAGGSSDADGDALKFTWSNGKTGVKTVMTFATPGKYEVALTTTDPTGAKTTAMQTIHVGNARPVVRFTTPANGSFFDWKEKIKYTIEVKDAETPKVDANFVSLQGEFRGRRFLTDVDAEITNPGLALMRKSTCFACHISDAVSAGPSYEMVAKKYATGPGAREQLAKKILTGGAGVWGQVPMVPHPQHTIEQARMMVDWVLSLADNTASTPRRGTAGVYAGPTEPTGRTKEGVLLLTAGFTDAGADGALPLRGEASIVLHSRRKKAALYDVNHGMQYVEGVAAENGLLGLFEHGDYIIFRDLNLDGIKSILVHAGNLTKDAARFELRQSSPKGKLLAVVNVKPTGEGKFVEIPAQLKNANGLTDVCVVANTKGVLGLNWIEFQE